MGSGEGPSSERDWERGGSGSPSGAGSPSGTSGGQGSLGDGLRQTARTASSVIRGQAAQLAQEIGHELTETGESQKERGVEAIRRFAKAIDSAASELHGQSPTLASSVHEAARQVEGLSDNLSNRNVGELVDSAVELARAQPALFIGGSVAAGFALARFLKSSSRRGRTNGGDASVRYDRY